MHPVSTSHYLFLLISQSTFAWRDHSFSSHFTRYYQRNSRSISMLVSTFVLLQILCNNISVISQSVSWIHRVEIVIAFY